MVWLWILLGKYTYQFILLSTPLPTILFSAALFSRDMTRRRFFVLRVFFCIVLLIAMNLGLAVLRTDYSNIYTRIIAYVFSYCVFLPLLLICFSDSFANVLLNWCAAVAADDIGNRIFTLLVMVVGNDHTQTISLFPSENGPRDWILYYLIRLVICFILYLIFRRAKCLETDRESLRNMTGLSVFFAAWLVVFQAFSRQYMTESTALYAVITVSAAVFSFAVFLLRTGILTQNRFRQEITMMEKFLSEERKQYDSVKENIEIVNMRCHDLKHQLEDLSYKLTEGEVEKLKNALRIYDSSVKTGNEVLDVVIYEKQLVFEKEGIRFTCMADGNLLKFMRTTHIYSLFSNALGNALEAVRKLSDPEKKLIDLNVTKAGNSVEITVSNYFDGTLPIDDTTTKQDKNRHGLGIKSMRYIAELYHGTLTASANGEIFELACRIPLMDNPSKKA